MNNAVLRRRIERALCVAATALLVFAVPSLASELEPGDRVAYMKRAVEGDLAALDDLQGEDELGRWAHFYRGFSFHAAGRDADAVDAWQSAARLGHNTAPTALAWHHYERQEWLEAYAWARVAMEVDAALGDLEMADLQGGWTLYTAVQTAEALDRDQHATADALARQYLAEYLDALVAEDLATLDEQNYDPDAVVDRRPPVFPRTMWENGQPGWAYLYFEIRADGRVGEIVPIGASHPRFGRVAARAIKRWRFDTEALDDLPMTGVQMVTFDLR